MATERLMTTPQVHLARAEGQLENALKNILSYGMSKNERFTMALHTQRALKAVRDEIFYRGPPFTI